MSTADLSSEKVFLLLALPLCSWDFLLAAVSEGACTIADGEGWQAKFCLL